MSDWQPFSTTQITLVGTDSISMADQEFIANKLRVDDRLYLRNVFEDKDNPGLLAVMRQKCVIGYIPSRSQQMLIDYVRDGKIGNIVVASKRIKAFSCWDIKIKVYYEDNNGTEFLFANNSPDVCVLESSKWPTPGDWQENWYYDRYNGTELLFYAYRELYGSDSDYNAKHGQIDLAFTLFLKQYLVGEIQSKDEAMGPTLILNDQKSISIYLTRVRSFLNCFGYTDITAK